jgi:RNA polymerase sigma-70 factor (sigma-E family)
MADPERSFDEFVCANADGLLKTAFLLSWDRKEAEDLVQECLFKVSRRWSRVGSMRKPVAYARRVLINLAIDDARARARRNSELYPPAAEAGADWPEFERLESRLELVAALQALPPRQRAVIVLRYFLDLSEADTATALGCSVGTVKSTSSKALARLRESLDNDRRPSEVPKP